MVRALRKTSSSRIRGVMRRAFLVASCLLLTGARWHSTIRADHYLKDKTEDGTIIILDDDSIWEIASIDRAETSIWLEENGIDVVKAEQPVDTFKYVLINVDDNGEKASAAYLGQE